MEKYLLISFIAQMRIWPSCEILVPITYWQKPTLIILADEVELAFFILVNNYT